MVSRAGERGRGAETVLLRRGDHEHAAWERSVPRAWAGSRRLGVWASGVDDLDTPIAHQRLGLLERDHGKGALRHWAAEEEQQEGPQGA